MLLGYLFRSWGQTFPKTKDKIQKVGDKNSSTLGTIIAQIWGQQLPNLGHTWGQKLPNLENNSKENVVERHAKL